MEHGVQIFVFLGLRLRYDFDRLFIRFVGADFYLRLSVLRCRERQNCDYAHREEQKATVRVDIHGDSLEYSGRKRLNSLSTKPFLRPTNGCVQWDLDWLIGWRT